MVENFEHKAPADSGMAGHFDASKYQIGASYAGRQRFEQTLTDLGASPNIDKLATAFPQLREAVADQYKAAKGLLPPEGSLPIQWELNDLHNPAWKLGNDLTQKPGALGLQGAEEAKDVLIDYAEGRKNDQYGDVAQVIGKLSALDPRVAKSKLEIDKILNGPHKDDYDAYRTKYIPFADVHAAAISDARNMQTRVEDRIYGASGLTSQELRNERISMLWQMHLLRPE